MIPRTLAENAGLDQIDILVNLRARHEGGGTYIGLDVASGELKDMMKAGVIEPLRVKEQVIKSAADRWVSGLRGLKKTITKEFIRDLCDKLWGREVTFQEARSIFEKLIHQRGYHQVCAPSKGAGERFKANRR